MTSSLDALSTLVSLNALPEPHRSSLACLPPEIEQALVRALYREWKNNPLAAPHLVELCSRSLVSEFSLAEWVEQVVRMYEWLHERRSTAAFSDVLEYVSCAFEGSTLQPGHNLDWYLNNYGFERATSLG
jgi:hypothetical protein